MLATTLLPDFDRSRAILGVGKVRPSPSQAVLGSSAGHLVPPVIEEGDVAVVLGHPDEARNRIGQRAEPSLALAAGFFDPLPLGDIPEVNGNSAPLAREAAFVEPGVARLVIILELPALAGGRAAV